MKRTLLLVACMVTSLAMSAQGSGTEDFDYFPFVREGKHWHVVRTDATPSYHFDQYILGNEKVIKDGKTYMKMYRSEDLLAVVYDAGLLREENRKVYLFDSDKQEEILVFDYSLKAGDTYETYSYDDQKNVSYKVMSVSDYTAGPEIIRYVYEQTGDSITTERRFLRKWKVCRTDDNSFQKTWIEGVGCLEEPLANLYDSRPVSSMSYLAYVDDHTSNELYLPFSFYDTLNNTANRQVHGCNLPTGAANHSYDDGYHQLTYEQESNRLHIYGKVFTQCGPNNYAYFIEEPTNDPLVHKLQFKIQEVEPLADCMALHQTNFYVSGFDPNMNYIVVDNQGKEHPVINKTPQMAYRPMIEEGKVWKIGAVNSGNPVQWVEYYYFDGDTIIDGKTCKQMVRQRYVNPDYPNYEVVSQDNSFGYEGAWYEEDQKVYTYDMINKQFQIMYDFSLGAYDSLRIKEDYPPFVLGPKQTGGLKGFKGVYRFLCNHTSNRSIWMEGVGSIDGPTINAYYSPGQVNPSWFLMSCSVGDEVIYLNDEYEDGATPESINARKNHFDFSHTIKTRPKAPMKKVSERSSAGEAEESEMQIYGEYNDQQLGINLNPLDDAYLVRITDESGKTTYERSINAGNIVALNVDISSYAKGRYTVTIENSRESFVGEFDSQATGIEMVRSERSELRGIIYNLQGQRLKTLQKGLNIVNGQKIYVR